MRTQVYKSFIICLLQLGFASASCFSGASLLDSLSIMAYNVFFTGFPVMAAALDQDVPVPLLAAHPRLYADVAASDALVLSPRSLALWVGRAAYQAALLLAVPACAFGGGLSSGGLGGSDADQVRAPPPR